MGWSSNPTKLIRERLSSFSFQRTAADKFSGNRHIIPPIFYPIIDGLVTRLRENAFEGSGPYASLGFSGSLFYLKETNPAVGLVHIQQGFTEFLEVLEHGHLRSFRSPINDCFDNLVVLSSTVKRIMVLGS
jgi:hypothetical protein